MKVTIETIWVYPYIAHEELTITKTGEPRKHPKIIDVPRWEGRLVISVDEILPLGKAYVDEFGNKWVPIHAINITEPITTLHQASGENYKNRFDIPTKLVPS